MKFNKAIYDDARKRFGLTDSVWVNGQEFARIPTDPAALLFWAADRIAAPVFGADGELRDWRVADADTTQKYRVLVEETARANGFEFKGLDAVFGSATTPGGRP